MRLLRPVLLFAAFAASTLIYCSPSLADDPGKPVGGLRWEGGAIVPCSLDWRPSESPATSEPSSPTQQPQQRSQAEVERQRRLQEGLRLNKLGYEQFIRSNWDEAIRLYRLALENRPDDADILRNLQMAQVALRNQQLQKQIEEEHRRNEAAAIRQMGEGLDSLATTLAALRADTCFTLLRNGSVDEALRAPVQSGFLMDSRVVDLRHVRLGVVNMDVLKPPPSLTNDVEFPSAPANSGQNSQVDFPKMPVQKDSPAVVAARAVLKSPELDALLFSATLREALQTRHQTTEQDSARFARVVAEEAARRSGVPYRSVEVLTPEGLHALEATRPKDGSYLQRAEAKARTAFARYLDHRITGREEARVQATTDFGKVEEHLRSQGLLTRGETLFEKEQRDPSFKARLEPETRRVVLRYEVSLLAAEQKAFGELLAEVGEVLVAPAPRAR